MKLGTALTLLFCFILIVLLLGATSSPKPESIVEGENVAEEPDVIVEEEDSSEENIIVDEPIVEDEEPIEEDPIIEEENLTMLAGINYVNWTPHDYVSQRFKNDGLTRVSIRMYWNVVETSRGSYSATGLNLYKNLIAGFGGDDIDVNVTFWTQCQNGAEDPQWVKNLQGYNPFIKATNETVKQAWLDWVDYMVTNLKGYSNIDSWSILNEPFYSTSTQRNGWVDLMEREVDIIRALDSRTVLCRFTGSHSPGAGRYPDSVYDLFDVMGYNLYNHPETYPLADYRTDPFVYNHKWWMYKDTVSDCAARSLPLWIMEFGAASNTVGHGTLTEEEQRQYFEDMLVIFDNSGVARAYGYAWRHTTPDREPWNLWTGYRTKLAYDELLNYLDAPPTPPTYYKTFTADAGLQATYTKTLTANAELLVPPEVEPVPKPFTCDAVLEDIAEPDIDPTYPEPPATPYDSNILARALTKDEKTRTPKKMVVI